MPPQKNGNIENYSSDRNTQCPCGKTIVYKSNGTTVVFSSHALNECILIAEYAKKLEQLEVEDESMPEGLKICSTKSLEPRSYKCAVYTHRKDTKVTFPSEYYKCHTYIGQHGNTKYKFDQRNSNHRSFGNISSNEIMMALIESDEHDPIKDVETVGITLMKKMPNCSLKNGNVEYRRITQMSEQKFREYARIFIKAMKMRYDSEVEKSKLNGSFLNDCRTYREKIRRDNQLVEKSMLDFIKILDPDEIVNQDSSLLVDILSKDGIQSFLTITVNFLDENFMPVSYFLDSVPIDNFYKGIDVTPILDSVIEKYGIKKPHLIVRCAGMRNAAKLKKYESIWCLTDVINWAIFYGLAKVKNFDEIIRKTSIECSDWKDLIPVLNSIKNGLSDNELNVINDVLEVLLLFKAVVYKFEKWSVSIGITIRLFMAIKYTLLIKPVTDKCPEMRTAIVDELEVLVGNCQTNPNLIASTLLDPKFKDTVFLNDRHVDNIFGVISKEMRVDYIKEWDDYLKYKVDQFKSPYEFWRSPDVSNRFPNLKRLAKRYLSVFFKVVGLNK